MTREIRHASNEQAEVTGARVLERFAPVFQALAENKKSSMTIDPLNIPASIPFKEIVLGERGRSEHRNIEELAQSIHDKGLIQPIVISIDGTLLAGGRRYTALALLGTETLYHARTGVPGEPGFIVSDKSARLDRLIIELGENLDRDDMPWQDEMKMLVEAYMLAKRDANMRGEDVLMRDFGAMLGCGYQDLRAAVTIYDDYCANPDRYLGCPNVRRAVAILMDHNAKAIGAELASRSGAKPSNEDSTPLVKVQAEPKQQNEKPVVEICLRERFALTNGIELLESMSPDQLDHIICDPDYAIDVERLESNSQSAGTGVVQKSVTESLNDLRRIIASAAFVLPPTGVLVMWCDPERWDWLKMQAQSGGFRVQRWPIIWHKVGFCSNAAPNKNFPKDYEFAIVCYKPQATLAEVQTTSIIQCPVGDVVKKFGHPFAKPLAVWKRLFAAFCHPGQRVFDPCVGSGSSAVAGLQFGLDMMGAEITADHYSSLIVNLQTHYKSANPNADVRFI